MPKRNKDWCLILDLRFVNKFICPALSHGTPQVDHRSSSTRRIFKFTGPEQGTITCLSSSKPLVLLSALHEEYTCSIQGPPLQPFHCPEGLHQGVSWPHIISQTAEGLCSPFPRPFGPLSLWDQGRKWPSCYTCLQNHGLLINLSKSELILWYRLQHLGMIINTYQFALFSYQNESGKQSYW